MTVRLHPDWLFHEVVIPCFQEYMENQTSYRHGFQAAVFCFSMRDWSYLGFKELLAAEGITSKTKYDNYLSERDPSYSIVRDVANAAKHMILTLNSPSLGDPTAVHINGFTCESACDEALSHLYVRKSTGESYSLGQLLSATTRMWKQELQKRMTETPQGSG